MKTCLISSDTLSNRIDSRLADIGTHGRALSCSEFVQSIISRELDRLDKIDEEKPGFASIEFLSHFVNLKKRQGRGPGTARHVIRVDDGKEYASCAHAALDMGVTIMSIRSAVSGRIKRCKGFSWKYADEVEDDFFEED